MAFKIGSIGPKLAAIARIPAIGGVRGRLKTPLGQGVAAALVLVAALFGWLAFEADDTFQTLEAAIPPATAVLPPKPEPVAANPAPAKPASEPAGKTGGAQPDLIEMTAAGALPRIGTDGTQPWRAYARPDEPASNKPRIAILVVGLGVSTQADDRAIHALPGQVSLAFVSFSDHIGALIGQARKEGHEVVLNAPMEPENYPADDPGPQTLLFKASAADNVARLDWHLARGAGYIGIAPFMGNRFTASPEPLQPVLVELAKRGLLYVDTGSAAFGAAPALARTIGVPIAISDRTIDRVPTRAAIDRELADLETLAKRRGSAFAISSASPATLDRLAAWTATLEAKGIALVPVSSIAQAPGSAPAQPRSGS